MTTASDMRISSKDGACSNDNSGLWQVALDGQDVGYCQKMAEASSWCASVGAMIACLCQGLGGFLNDGRDP